MNAVGNAEFRLETFMFPRFYFEEVDDTFNELNVSFNPSGDYKKESGIFRLQIDFKGIATSEHTKQQKEVVAAQLEAIFVFPEKPEFSKLPDYFYGNGIAIVYPFLRSFISTITLQANVKLLMLPILNLTALEKMLRDQTKAI